MHDTGPLLTAIIGGIVLAAILGLVANRLKISPLVGYLVAGIIFGPATPGFVADVKIVQDLAEIGVILLMFGVGLHFSLKDLMEVKNIAIPGAIVQIAVSTLLGIGMGFIMGWSILTGLIFGLCLSTASTVVLLRALEERNLIESQRGGIAIGWLIVEDLAMVLALVLLPAITTLFNESESYNVLKILNEVGKTVGLVVLFIVMMIVIGRRVIPWLLAKSAGTGSDELFTLSVLGIALGIALLAVQLFGASFALGAFFAGMVLKESELSHRAASNILPLKDAFAVLFFVSVGMLFDPSILIEHPIATFSTVVVIILGKSIAAYLIVRLFGHSRRTALTISASLAQIGEFSYILAALGIMLNIFPKESHSLVLAGSIISILLNPFLFNLLERYLKRIENNVDKIIDPISSVNQMIPDDLSGHAIIVGYGRLGSAISNKLIDNGIPFIVIDNSLALVEHLHNEGVIALLGNASDFEVLEQAHIKKAKWLIISSPNGYESANISYQAREACPDLKIYVRAFYDDEAQYITEKGATAVITGTEEIAKYILERLNLDDKPQIDENEFLAKPKKKELKKKESVVDIPIKTELPDGGGSKI